MKRCTGKGACKKRLPESDFGANKSQDDGLQTMCRACTNARAKARKLARADANHAERLKDMSPRQRTAALQLRAEQVHAAQRRQTSMASIGPKSLELCQTYVTKLRLQRRGLGSSFPRLTQKSLEVWEQRLLDHMGQEEYDRFIREVAGA